MADARLQVVIDTTDNASKKIKTVGQSIEQVARHARRAGMALTALGGAITGLAALSIKASSSLAESTGAVQVMFGEGSAAILEFGKTSAQTVGLSSAAFNQLASTTGAMLLNFGIPMKNATQFTIALTQRAADLASTFDTTVAEAMAAMQSGLQGMAIPLRRYAVDVSESSLQTKALGLGITKSVAEMTQSEKAYLRLAVIMEQSDRVAGDYIRTGENFANSMRTAQGLVVDLAASMGDALVPSIERALMVARPLLENLKVWAEKNPGLIQGVVLLGTATLALGVALTTVGFILPAMISGFKLLTWAVVILRTAIMTAWVATLGWFAFFGAAMLSIQHELVQIQRDLRLIDKDSKSVWENMVGGVGSAFSALDDALFGSIGATGDMESALADLDKQAQDMAEALRLAILAAFMAGAEGAAAFSVEAEAAQKRIETMTEAAKELDAIWAKQSEEMAAAQTASLERGLLGLGADTEEWIAGLKGAQAQMQATAQELAAAGLNAKAAWEIAAAEMKGSLVDQMRAWADQVEHGSSIFDAFLKGTLTLREAFTALEGSTRKTTEALIENLVFMNRGQIETLRSQLRGNPLIAAMAASYAAQAGMLAQFQAFMSGGAIESDFLAMIRGWIQKADEAIASAYSGYVQDPMAPGSSGKNPAGYHAATDPPGTPAMAHGGIVTRPTMAMIGEAGPEAVIPLSNNNQPIIILQIDGRTIASVLGGQAALGEQVRSS